jgi:hypothetical protein
MLSLKNASTSIPPRGRHLVVHAIGGVGKTTMAINAAKANNGFMIITGEDGVSPLGITPLPSNVMIGCNLQPGDLDGCVNAWRDYQNILKELITEKHDYKLIVQDPLSSMVNGPIFEGYIVKTFYGGDYNKANSYMAKYAEYQTEFNKIIEAYKIILSKGIDIITFSHSVVMDFKDPSTESYKKWEIALPAGNKMNLSSSLFNHADGVFFGCYDVTVIEGKAIGNKRILRTTPQASYTAKNMRLPAGKAFPEQILFDYNTYKTLLEKKE